MRSSCVILRSYLLLRRATAASGSVAYGPPYRSGTSPEVLRLRSCSTAIPLYPCGTSGELVRMLTRHDAWQHTDNVYRLMSEQPTSPDVLSTTTQAWAIHNARTHA